MWNLVASLMAVLLISVVAVTWGKTMRSEHEHSLYRTRNVTAAAKLHEFSQAVEAYYASDPTRIGGCDHNHPCQVSPQQVEPNGWNATNGWGQGMHAIAWKDPSGSGPPVVFAYYTGKPSKSALAQVGMKDTPQSEESLAYSIGATYMSAYAGPNEVPAALNGRMANGMDNSFQVKLAVNSREWEPGVLNNYDLSPVKKINAPPPPGGGNGGGNPCKNGGCNINPCPGNFVYNRAKQACCPPSGSSGGFNRCVAVP